MSGVVAAGHPETARAGADVLRAGGNAVDAAVAAVLTSVVVEPMMTGLAGGGYLMVAPPGGEPTLLDFFVTAPGAGADPADRAPLLDIEVSFGDAVQVFGAGAASCGVYGLPAGLAAAVERFGSMPLAELTAPAAALARDGAPITEVQAAMFALMAPILATGSTRYLTDGVPPAAGTVLRDPELADALDLLGGRGAGAVLHRAGRGRGRPTRCWPPAAWSPGRTWPATRWSSGSRCGCATGTARW